MMSRTKIGLPVALALDHAYCAGISDIDGNHFRISTADRTKLVCPAGTYVFNGRRVDLPKTTLSPILPSASREIFRVVNGVVTLPNAAQTMARLAITITNGTAGAISGGSLSFVGPNSQYGYELGDTVSYSSINPGQTRTIYSNANKFFAAVTAITQLPAALQATGVTISAVESHSRYHIYATPEGYAYSAANRNDGSVLGSSVTYDPSIDGRWVHCAVIDVDTTRIRRIIPELRSGPRFPGSDVPRVQNMSGGRYAAPRLQGGNCEYAIGILTDGRVIHAGNAGWISLCDSNRWGEPFTPPALANQAIESINALYAGFIDYAGKEIVYFGTTLGKLFRWNVTDNVWSTISFGWPAGVSINAIVRGYQENYFWVLGDAGNINLVQDNSASGSPTATGWSYKTQLNAGTDNLYAAAVHNRCLYVAGGGVSGMKLFKAHHISYGGSGDAPTWRAENITPYLPGTAAAISTNANAAIRGLAINPQGLLGIVGQGSALYIATMDLERENAKCVLSFAFAAGSAVAASDLNIPRGGRILVGHSLATVSSVAVSGSEVTLTLSAAIAAGVDVRVAYTDPTSGNDAAAIQDTSGVDALTLLPQLVTNVPRTSPGASTAPEFLHASLNATRTQIVLTYNKPLGAANPPAANRFVVAVGGVVYRPTCEVQHAGVSAKTQAVVCQTDTVGIAGWVQRGANCLALDQMPTRLSGITCTEAGGQGTFIAHQGDYWQPYGQHLTDATGTFGVNSTQALCCSWYKGNLHFATQGGDYFVYDGGRIQRRDDVSALGRITAMCAGDVLWVVADEGGTYAIP